MSRAINHEPMSNVMTKGVFRIIFWSFRNWNLLIFQHDWIYGDPIASYGIQIGYPMVKPSSWEDHEFNGFFLLLKVFLFKLLKMFSFMICPSRPCIFLLLALVHSCETVTLPEGNIIAAWQNWGACNETQTLQAVERGVNVIFWFSLNLVKDDNQPKVSGAIPDPECVAKVRQKILEKELPTRHLISIGGWDAPHPDISFSGAEWFQAWHSWNQALPMPFDGFDWDLEGLMASSLFILKRWGNEMRQQKRTVGETKADFPGKLNVPWKIVVGRWNFLLK